jgi:hypothetical protein
MDDDGFQVNERKKQSGPPASVRVYIGGLPVRDGLDQEVLSWLEQNLPQNISISAIEIKQGGGKGKKQGLCFALIECGRHTNEVIRALMGRSFEGHQLTVQREQRTGNNSNQKNDNKLKLSQHRGGTGRGGRGRNNNFKSTFSRKGWSSPSESTTKSFPDGTVAFNLEGKEESDHVTHLTMEETSSKLSVMVSNEIEQAGDDADNLITAVLASTAAATFLTSVMTAVDFSVDDDRNNVLKVTSPMEQPITEPIDLATDESNFASFVKGQSLSALLADFGEEDPDWKKVEASPCTPSEQETGSSNKVAVFEQKSVPRLAPQGKAPIHICLESFGYVHGAPSRQSQDFSWSPYTQPLAPIDCRSLFEPAPSYLDFHDGLRSGQVKRVLLQQSRSAEQNDERVDSSASPEFKDIQDYAKRILARKDIWDALLEAQNLGHHGYVSPLQMKILVGSHLGRHRSVLVVEWAAIELRNLLRKNKDNVILQPVSVGTLHRDIEKRIPTRKYKEDNDDDRSQ